VYILRSIAHPDQTYIGSTSNLKNRLGEHNAGESIHTNKFKPWELAAYVALPERAPAERFERYLKTGSGRAFVRRHLLTPPNEKA
jgi:predicted GIY-YIG superfamily endonuclease